MRLTDREREALRRIHLGGMGALRTETYTCACATVSALIRKGMLGRDGLSAAGRAAAREIAETFHQEAMEE